MREESEERGVVWVEEEEFVAIVLLVRVLLIGVKGRLMEGTSMETTLIERVKLCIMKQMIFGQRIPAPTLSQIIIMFCLTFVPGYDPSLL